MKYLYNLKESKHIISNIATFDTETWGLGGGFALGVVYINNTFHRFTDKDKMLNFMLQHKHRYYKFYAHNIEFDLNKLTENLLTFFDGDKDTVKFSGSLFLSATKYFNDKDCVEFRNSLALFKSKLSDISIALGYPKGKTPDKFIKGKICKLEETDFKYCELDCEILYKALIRFQDFVFDRFGCNLKLTIGSQAMNIYLTKFIDRKYKVNSLHHRFRDSYRGGRVEVFKKGYHGYRVYLDDINSLYPFVMSKNLYPDFENLQVSTQKSIFHNVLSDFEGVANVQLENKDNIPIIPYKTVIDGTEKLIFPSGKFRTWVNFNELRFALDRGYKLIDVDKFVWGKPKDYFSEYVTEIYGLRKKASNDFDKLTLKYLLNSLYGKFGQKVKDRKFGTFNNPPDDKSLIFQPFSPISEFGYWGNNNIHYVRHTIFSMCSYVTSYARMELYKLLEKLDFDVIYCDTDSIVTEKRLGNKYYSNELGKLKTEYVIDESIFLFPKHYWLSGKNIKKVKIKGVKVKYHTKNTVLKHCHKFDRVVKSHESLRHYKKKLKAGQLYKAIKNLNFDNDKRIFDNNTDFSVTYSESKPINIS